MKIKNEIYKEITTVFKIILLIATGVLFPLFGLVMIGYANGLQAGKRDFPVMLKRGEVK